MKDMYTVREVALIFNLSYSQVINHMRSAGIPVIRYPDEYHKAIEGRHLMAFKRYEDEYMEYIKKGGAKNRWRGKIRNKAKDYEIEQAKKELGL